MLARKFPIKKNIDMRKIAPAKKGPIPRSKEEIEKMLEGGESVVKYHTEFGREPNYVKGVVDALKWVLRKDDGKFMK
jgi:hypothetical protein